MLLVRMAAIKCPAINHAYIPPVYPIMYAISDDRLHRAAQRLFLLTVISQALLRGKKSLLLSNLFHYGMYVAHRSTHHVHTTPSGCC